ncbi:hypothetical protein GCM10010435_82550 [Winogradskya consettensis]
MLPPVLLPPVLLLPVPACARTGLSRTANRVRTATAATVRDRDMRAPGSESRPSLPGSAQLGKAFTWGYVTRVGTHPFMRL